MVLVHYRDLSKGKVGNAACTSNHFSGKNMMHDSSHSYHMPNDTHLYREPQFSTESLSQSTILPTNRPLEYNTERKQEDDVDLLQRFVKMVSLRTNMKIQACAVENCQNCNLKKDLFPMLCSDMDWDKLDEDIRSPKDALVQQMKRTLYDWLIYKAHEDRGLSMLNEEGHGVIHLASALGCLWAIKAIVTAGVNPSFRDAKGRTGLHWAAYYGREETVLELIRLGVAPGAVKNPTSKNPEVQTAADVAWINGHKGIAGYLAELDLRSHLSEIILVECELGTVSAYMAAEDASETSQRQMTGALDGDGGIQLALALHRLLFTVRNSELAAKCVQTALNSESRQDPSAIGFNDYLCAIISTKNQQKLNGDRGNSEFLEVHSRFVEKAEPHGSEEQGSKPYENIVQAVNSLEMAALCWAHKSAGLQGFRSAKGASCWEQEAGECQFLSPSRQQNSIAMMKSLERVKSMALQPDAREQYMRLLISSLQPQLGTQSTHLAHVER